MANNKEIASFAQERMRVSLLEQEGQIVVSWGGVFDAVNPNTTLGEFLAKQSDVLRSKEVLVDFSKTEFLNSTTLSVMLRFVKELDGIISKLTLLFDTAESWQMVSFRCMKAISRTLKHTEVLTT
jgi:anti-anti-sigma regulatory factor